MPPSSAAMNPAAPEFVPSDTSEFNLRVAMLGVAESSTSTPQAACRRSLEAPEVAVHADRLVKTKCEADATVYIDEDEQLVSEVPLNGDVPTAVISTDVVTTTRKQFYRRQD